MLKRFKCGVMGGVLLLLAVSAFGQTITVKYGDYNMRLPINEDVYVPVYVHCDNANILIGNFCIPLGTDNDYIVDRHPDGILHYPLTQWDDASFVNEGYLPVGKTTQTLLGFADIVGGPNPWLDPPEWGYMIIADFKMTTTSNTFYIGLTVDFLSSGLDPFQPLCFGDTFGGPGYSNIIENFYQATLIACTTAYHLGEGIGVMNDPKDSIETACSAETTFVMRDGSRCRYVGDPHGHDGFMGIGQYIRTYYSYSGHNYVPAHDIDNTWDANFQKAAVDAQVYTGWVYDYMWHELGRNGPDSVGGQMFSMVDDPNVPDNNAIWDTTFKEVHFGNAGTGRRSFAGALDMVAHEWAHGITWEHAHFNNTGEPRALNETFSDMFGVLVAKTYNDNDWLIGENTFNDGRPIRNMANPHNSNPAQPAYYQETGYWNSSDPYNMMGSLQL